MLDTRDGHGYGQYPYGISFTAWSTSATVMAMANIRVDIFARTTRLANGQVVCKSWRRIPVRAAGTQTVSKAESRSCPAG